ncbi:MAG: DegT/DnrJ/EryC1/StrS family aminotransferase [Deltaproteobacteria bacterium]|nr:DegT/DnrJ/EryC1/StrS family aminotransferase [Deltaproteobacteria bacterium]
MIREFLRCDYVVPVGSGTAGLFSAPKAIDIHNKKVLIPASNCPSAAIVAFAARGKPVAVDLSYSDHNISPGSVRNAMGAPVRAIIAVDAFWLPGRYSETEKHSFPVQVYHN